MSERFGTARQELQDALGELGEAVEFVQRSDLAAGYPYVGHYARLARQEPSCMCERCRATRAGRLAFLGGRRLEALQGVGAYKASHPSLT